MAQQFKSPLDQAAALETRQGASFKNGQFNRKEEWNKVLDEMAAKNPAKKAQIDSMRDYDDEKVELAMAFMALMKGDK